MKTAIHAVAGLFAVVVFTTPGVCLVVDPAPTGLQATLSMDKNGSIHAVYHNGTSQDVKINRQVIDIPILSLDVWDASGVKVPPTTPPVPWAKTLYVVIPPGKNCSVTYQLSHFTVVNPVGITVPPP